MKFFLINAGAAGIAIEKDGDIVSVFKNTDMAQKDDIDKINKELLITSIKEGGKRLDCFDGFLPELYSKFGFQAVCKLKFNDEFAPEDWNFKRDGRPDIISMVHNGDSIEEIIEKQRRNEYSKYELNKDKLPYVNDYESAVELAKRLLKEKEEIKEEVSDDIGIKLK